MQEADPDDEDKYKRRSVLTWFARWLRSRQSTNRKGSSNRSQISRTRYTTYMICVIFFVFITLLTVLYHLTRGGNDDPQFNPLNNPFVRVAGRFLNKSPQEQPT